MSFYKWKQSLLLWLSVPYALGILLRYIEPVQRLYAVGCVVFFGIIVLVKSKLLTTYQKLFLSAVFCGLCVLGWTNLACQLNRTVLVHQQPLWVKITSSPKPTASGGCTTYGEAYQNHNRIPVYAHISHGATSLTYGDWVYADAAKPMRFRQPLPGAFDFKRFLRQKGVRDAIVMDKAVVHPSKSLSIMGFASRLKQQLLQQIGNLKLSTRSKAIVAGLLVGDKSSMDRTTRDVFTTTGVMHVFAVSGLHVGILYGMMVHLLLVCRVKAWIQLLLMLIVVWSFALVTGLHASVCRAGLMISILELGRVTKRGYVSMNALGFAAIVLLSLTPHALFQLGFQLSFLALLGIFLVGQPLMNKLKGRPFYWRFLGGIVAMSLGAQLAVAPLLMYHFHSFPVLFLIANIVMVPLVPVLIVLSILALLSSGLVGSSWLALWLDQLLRTQYSIMEAMSDLSFSSLDNIPVRLWALVLVYLVMALMIARWRFGVSRFHVFRRSSQLIALGLLMETLFHIRQTRTTDVLHYETSSHIQYAIRAGNDLYLMGPTKGGQERASWHAFAARNNLMLYNTPIPIKSYRESNLLPNEENATKKPDVWLSSADSSGYQRVFDFPYK